MSYRSPTGRRVPSPGSPHSLRGRTGTGGLQGAM